MRKVAHIISGKLASCACPNCSHELSGATGVMMGGFFQRRVRLKGEPTMCTYCGALLIFADDAGNVRAMTERERNSVHFAPVIQQLLDCWRRDKVHPPDFTKKRFN